MAPPSATRPSLWPRAAALVLVALASVAFAACVIGPKPDDPATPGVDPFDAGKTEDAIAPLGDAGGDTGSVGYGDGSADIGLQLEGGCEGAGDADGAGDGGCEGPADAADAADAADVIDADANDGADAPEGDSP